LSTNKQHSLSCALIGKPVCGEGVCVGGGGRAFYYRWRKKKVIGKFKDESPDEVIESFVGIRSKCHTFKTKNNVVKKAKGVSKVVS
jgi:hypothetical protein